MKESACALLGHGERRPAIRVSIGTPEQNQILLHSIRRIIANGASSPIDSSANR